MGASILRLNLVFVLFCPDFVFRLSIGGRLSGRPGTSRKRTVSVLSSRTVGC